MEIEKMKEIIIDIVRTKSDATFAEFTLTIGEDAKGKFSMDHQQYENMCFWVNMSENFYVAVDQLLSEKKIHMKPTINLVYLMDGYCPSLPLAKKAQSYKKPHWFPVIFESIVRKSYGTESNSN